MNIYILLGAPVMGELSPDTTKTWIAICETCNRRKVLYSNITYVFDRWRGEDLIKGLGQFFISQRLKEKLEEKDIKGYKVTPVNATFSKQRGGVTKFGKGAYQKELPAFYYFEVTGKATGAINDWFEIIDAAECEGCRKNKKMLSSLAYKSMSNPELTGEDTQDPLPLNVYKESWDGEAVFLPHELNLPIVSQNFVDALTELGIKINQREGIWLRPTNWIDDKGNVIN